MIGTDSYHILIQLAKPNDTIINSDYRYTSISILEIDNPATFKKTTIMSTGNIEPIMARSLGNGVVRLYREFEEEFEDNAVTLDSISGKDDVLNESDGTMISIIAVPTYFTATDLLGFIGEPYMKYITHIRIIKSDQPNRFLVLIKFKEIVKAAEFQFNYNGKAFNSMEPELCHAIFVKSVKLNKISDDTKIFNEANDSLIPFLLADPFTSAPVRTRNSQNDRVSSSESAFDKYSIELPTCPVCLERMDANITGLLTIPCQHTFHCQCLSKWKDDSCPICRYSNNVANRKARRSVRRLSQYSLARTLPSTTTSNSQKFHVTGVPESESIEKCVECDADTNLWICLICGNVGCGRYSPEQHSLKHFVRTGHCFAMELNTSRVWDYAGDNYVHRLVTNESDGKIVELPEKGNKDGSSSTDDYKKSNADKVDEVGFEYSQLLISQLASQREYYESLLESKEPAKSRRKSSLATLNTACMEDLENKIIELSNNLTNLTTNIVPTLKSKIVMKDEKINKLSKDLNTSNSLNDALSSKVDYLVKGNEDLTKKVGELVEQNNSLSEQVTDLMFFLDNQEKFKNESEEVRDGTIHIKQNAPKKSRSKKKKK